VGIDFGVWNNKLRGAFDVYYKKTEAYINQSQSFVTGTGGTIPSNTGSLYNRGFDFEMHYDLIKTKTLGNIKFCW
jgi:hypothetical protein